MTISGLLRTINSDLCKVQIQLNNENIITIKVNEKEINEPEIYIKKFGIDSLDIEVRDIRIEHEEDIEYILIKGFL